MKFFFERAEFERAWGAFIVGAAAGGATLPVILKGRAAPLQPSLSAVLAAIEGAWGAACEAAPDGFQEFTFGARGPVWWVSWESCGPYWGGRTSEVRLDASPRGIEVEVWFNTFTGVRDDCTTIVRKDEPEPGYYRVAAIQAYLNG